jgi:hypothetical protein
MIRLQNEHLRKQKGVGAIQLWWMVVMQFNYAAETCRGVQAIQEVPY